MASKYIKKYPIPQDFPLILKNFTRQILRDQPDNLIEYAVHYFQALEKGQKYKFTSSSNIPKEQKKYQLAYDFDKAQIMQRKDLRINSATDSTNRSQQKKVRAVVNLLFQKYDRNNDDKLQSAQIRNAVKQLYKMKLIDVMPGDAEMKDFIMLIDKNGDNKIEKRQMANFLKKLIF